jgi:hypothetical protein
MDLAGFVRGCNVNNAFLLYIFLFPLGNVVFLFFYFKNSFKQKSILFLKLFFSLFVGMIVSGIALIKFVSVLRQFSLILLPIISTSVILLVFNIGLKTSQQ